MAERRADMFIDPAEDPREDGPTTGPESVILADFLRVQRLTLELKCTGLDAEQLARRAVEPSTMSLLGLVRHMADVERVWTRKVMAGERTTAHFSSREDPDGDFDGAVADQAVVDEAWRVWRAEAANTDRFVAEAESLDVTGHGEQFSGVSLRWVVVHLIEEYARHNGHADLLRERIDGRLGQ